MISAADRDVTDALGRFTNRGIDAACLVPTDTGLGKSIMDATSPIRDLMKRTGLHDYSEQLQGQDHKLQVPAHFIARDRVIHTKASLYRPESKQGDPRIWFNGLKKYAEPWNLLVVIVHGGEIYVVNASQADVLDSIDIVGAPLAEIVARVVTTSTEVATDLLSKLKLVSAQGYIPTVTSGDTGVGMTLEAQIGIKPNASKSPDYNGIELKASRKRSGSSKNRVNLFAQVPDWSISRLKSSREILDAYGYNRDGEFRLYCTLDSKGPNSQGLFLSVDYDRDVLNELHGSTANVVDVVKWRIGLLRDRLFEKHPETFWVSADVRGAGSSEEFHYVKAMHTRGPNLGALALLLDDGRVTLDHLIKRDQNGQVRENGPLFKIHPDELTHIFPPPQEYDLQVA